MLRRPLTIVAPAKLNLTLDITGTLPQGYHAVRMVLQSIDLCDRVTLSQGEGSFRVAAPIFCRRGRRISSIGRPSPFLRRRGVRLWRLSFALRRPFRSRLALGAAAPMRQPFCWG